MQKRSNVQRWQQQELQSQPWAQWERHGVSLQQVESHRQSPTGWAGMGWVWHILPNLTDMVCTGLPLKRDTSFCPWWLDGDNLLLGQPHGHWASCPGACKELMKVDRCARFWCHKCLRLPKVRLPLSRSFFIAWEIASQMMYDWYLDVRIVNLHCIERSCWQMSKVMLESAGRACPDKERLVRDCIDPAMEAESTRLWAATLLIHPNWSV